MPHPDLAVVTGAFSYTGRYVTRRLLDQGVRVRTLTRSPDAEDPFGGQVGVAPLDFSDPDGLCHSMRGAGVFYNTYWVRYAHGLVRRDVACPSSAISHLPLRATEYNGCHAAPMLALPPKGGAGVRSIKASPGTYCFVLALSPFFAESAAFLIGCSTSNPPRRSN